MDDFKRMMEMEGVRRLDERRPSGRRHTRPTARQETPQSQPAPTAFPAGYAWVTGPRARQALDTAMARLIEETREGRRGWATGVRQDGSSVVLSATSGAAALLGSADRMSLRLMIVGGDGWTFVLHPQMGVATLDQDPEQDA